MSPTPSTIVTDETKDPAATPEVPTTQATPEEITAKKAAEAEKLEEVDRLKKDFAEAKTPPESTANAHPGPSVPASAPEPQRRPSNEEIEEWSEKGRAESIKMYVETSPVAVRGFMPGTVLKLGDTSVKLVEPAIVESDMNDSTYVGLLQMTGNLDVNRKLLKFRYDNTGKLLGLSEQVDNPNDLPAFIASLDEIEANSFGVDSQTLAEYKRNAAATSVDPEPETEG